MSNVKNPNVKTKAESGKRKAELIPDPSQPRRATSNDETSGNTKYFPIYFISVQNSRVSFEVDNLTTSKNLKFDKPRRILTGFNESCETNDGEMPNDEIPMSKEIQNHKSETESRLLNPPPRATSEYETTDQSGKIPAKFTIHKMLWSGNFRTTRCAKLRI